ncbi:hypothetical protein LF1_46720 [Rubripirellula obstinata]|uniref:Uncharacterized protein n=1 Tax=Rubripirellula obstinata TaxID=406547 RepID=A0A5B1CPD5_9BACT|nr:hypothetical protein LF1_46720 [Rubripirellula obstinata]
MGASGNAVNSFGPGKHVLGTSGESVSAFAGDVALITAGLVSSLIPREVEQINANCR